MKRIPLFFLIFSALCGCSSIQSDSQLSRQERLYLMSGQALFGSYANTIELPEHNFLQVNDAMRDYLNAVISPSLDTHGKIQVLIRAMTHPSMINFEYAGDVTLNAQDAFRRQMGNCLTFSALFIAMAREIGLKARFNEVDLPPSWGEAGDSTYLFFMHVNVNIDRFGNEDTIVDITPYRYKAEYNQRVIPDKNAEAQFYNNLGTEYLTRRENYHAFRYFKKALTLQPKSSFLWSNLGTLYRRMGLLAEAEKSFLYAAELDSSNLPAFTNLERFYIQTSQPQKAAYYKKRAEEARKSNPYYQYRMAEEAYEVGNYAKATEHSLAVSRINVRDHRNLFLLGKSYLMLGKRSQGEKYFKDALNLTDEQHRQHYQTEWQKLLANL